MFSWIKNMLAAFAGKDNTPTPENDKLSVADSVKDSMPMPEDGKLQDENFVKGSAPKPENDKLPVADSVKDLFKKYHRQPLENKKIVFLNFNGKAFYCNPKYIALALLDIRDDLDIVWLAEKEDMQVPRSVRTVLYNSEQAIRELGTAHVIVNNCMWFPGFIKRTDQYCIQTWHGGVHLLQFDFDNPVNVKNEKYKRRVKKNFACSDLVLSNSDFCNSLFRRAGYKGPILKAGSPRCDILLHPHQNLKQKVCSTLAVPQGKKIILYAPAYRKGNYVDTYVLDYDRLVESMGKDYTVLVRLHPLLAAAAQKFKYSDSVINATEYTDLHELMAVADILITDYSNIMFEFAAAGKPVFLFAPDLLTYSQKNAFYFDISSLPFPCFQSQDDLQEAMHSIDMEAYRLKAQAFLAEQVGLYESGQAAQTAAAAVNNLLTDDVHTIMPDGSVRKGVVQNVTPPSIISQLYDKYHTFPMDHKKLIFINFHGRGYGCNPKYIAQELLKRRKDLDLVWMVKEKAELPEGVRPVPYNSEQAIMEIATARVLIDNQMMFTGFKKRPDQFYINTWHGAIPLKKIGFDNPKNFNKKKYATRNACNFPEVDIMLSNSTFASDLYRRAFKYYGKLMETGYPRNDILVNTPKGLKAKVCSQLHLPQDAKLVLYAPTYRSDHSLDNFTLDYQRVLDALGSDHVMLIRLHPNQRSQANDLAYTETIVNASEYPDMQELMAVADLLITDYSNTMFEFALTGRPVYLYSPDVEEYRKERDYYFEIFDLPFPLAQTTEQLLDCMASHDQASYLAGVNEFFAKVGLHESGHAASDAADFIEHILDESNHA